MRITFPDGTVVSSDDADVDQVLSMAFGRQVTLRAVQQIEDLRLPSTHLDSWTLHAEEYRPDVAGLAQRDAVTNFDLSDETFFDSAVVHLLTTATLDRLRRIYPQGRFEVRRFRPIIMVSPSGGLTGFIEDATAQNQLNVGVYAAVVRGGRVHRGDPVGLL